MAEGILPSGDGYNADLRVGTGETTPAILSPLCRLLKLLHEPEAVPVLSPLILREIYYRLLTGEQAQYLRRIAMLDDQGYRIASVIDWLRMNYTSSFRIEQLASLVRMSAPSFHQHFRQLTGVSPLQYQKCLRLTEARRLIFSEFMDVASAAYSVGYESPSQFSREYKRMFGKSPKQNVLELRDMAEK